MNSVILPMDQARPRPSPTPTRAMRRAAPVPRLIADACYAALRLTGWLAITTLATMGFAVLFFMMVGDFTASGFFAQLANLANHFAAADEVRRSAFLGDMHIAAAIAFAFVALIRLPALIAIFGSRHA